MCTHITYVRMETEWCGSNCYCLRVSIETVQQICIDEDAIENTTGTGNYWAEIEGQLFILTKTNT